MKMKINFSSIMTITILIFGSYFISDSFAIDYRDSSGYTPSWAQGAGYHSVLMQCTEMVGDYSRDGNWCFEWTAYVLDQGVENFPESTKSTTSTSINYNLSERICTENKICVFPGEYIKYFNSDTYDDFEEIAIVEFKEKINNNTIRVFVDGFGSKPLTYNWNLKTGMETHDEYTNVNRPFSLLEPIPMKIGQKVSQSMEGYFESTISKEETVNLKKLGLIDITRTLMLAKTDLGNGDSVIRVYDKETGVLISNLETYEFEGKRYTAGFVLRDTNMFSVPTKISSTSGTTIQNNEQIFTNSESKSEITIETTAGSGAPGCDETAEGCYIPGTATVEVGGKVIFSNTDSAAHTFTSGDPTMPDTVQVLFDSGLAMAGSTFEWSPTEVGDVPYFCMVHPWMEGLIKVTEPIVTIPTTIKEETIPKQDPKPTPIQPKESQQRVSEDREIDDSSAVALGAFIVFGIPAILIGLFILRRKMKKIKIQKIKDAEWKGV